MTSSNAAVDPIVAGPGEGEALWSFDSLAAVKASAETTAGAVAVIEHLAPRGTGSPLHVHSREDEWFYVIEGELTFWVGGESIVAPAGTFVFGPGGIPHTFIVSSEGARFLLVTEPGGFERFMRTAGARRRGGDPATGDHGARHRRDERLAAEYGIEILGPPGIPS